ncbi:Serine/threonine protein kinase [Marinactinospora thermotolerans DSM 45154]|uniref:Serine/threonine protein kinase n=1 Tax=Marinactinospora thermotolerans DSM 45154 TaxID=1122192 RepID=A0A1T4T8M8_9ACTN|nr:serine/threonine-protein kinase [Marinactinospora thermotolerans]SKA36659.1 Serine/threonine protein kinase [Marinactinospora thermotolerans DSM 45154]
MTSNGHERARPLRTGDPTELGEYRILGRLGRGGMGTVYLARDSAERLVAVKLIHPDLSDDEDFRRRFAREVESARRVARFSTAAVLDARLDGDPLFIVSEYVAGPNLAQAIAAEGPMQGGTLDSLAMGVAAALSAIHRAGVIHRDLKPANVLLSSVGPKVIDFGIARAMDDDGAVTRSSQLMGTPAYLAPELIEGREISPASDIFSWGCLVVFAGTGRAPFEAPTVPAVLQQIVSMAPNLEGLDPTLRDLVSHALDKDPSRRPTAQQLLNRLVGQEDPSESVIDQTVVRSWTPPSTARPAPEETEGPTTTPSDGREGATVTEDLSRQATAALPPDPAPPTTPTPPGGRPSHPRDPAWAGPPSGPQGPSPSPSHVLPTGPQGVPSGPQGVPSGPQQGFHGPYRIGAAGHGTGHPGFDVPGSPPPAPPGFGGFGPPGPGAPGTHLPPGGQDGSAKRRRGLKAAGAATAGVVVLAAAVIGGVALFGGPSIPEGTPLYSDDFYSPETGWNNGQQYVPGDDYYDDGYYEGQYALRASVDDQPTRGEFAPYEGAVPDRILVGAKTVVDSGPGYGQMGLHCFHQDEEDRTRYEALVRLDGAGAQIRRVAGDEGGASALATTDEVPGFDTAEGAGNRLTLACELDRSANTMTLNLWVNDEHVLEAVDTAPLPHGEERDVGITVQRSSGGGDDALVMFDDFFLHRIGSDEPTDGSSAAED